MNPIAPVNAVNNKSNSMPLVAMILAVIGCLFAAFVFGKQQSEAHPLAGVAPVAPVAPIAPGPVSPTLLGRSDRSISISGTAEQRIAPDRATLVFKVTTRSKRPSEAQLENEQLSAKVIAAIKEAGAETKEINPGGLDITQETVREQNPLIPIQERESSIDVMYFAVSSEVTVVTVNLGNVGKIVRGAFDGGATTGSVQFSSTKMRKLADDARAAAMKAAVQKAEALIEIAGAKRGEVISINLDDYRYDPYRYGGTDRRVINNAQNSAAAADIPDTPSEMSDQFGGGMITVSATVSAVFAIVNT
jgi:uncharacterized protein